MGKPSSTRITPAGQRKAGKGRRAYQSPPAPNSDKQDRREAGKQQFHSIRPLTKEEPHLALVNGRLVSRMEAIPVPYRFDPHRKQIISSPRRKETKHA